MKAFQILKNPADTLPLVGEVVNIADRNREELGFLPRSAYFEMAENGKLWIAVSKDTSDIVGFLLFGGRRPNLKVTQLYVEQRSRSNGIGSTLIRNLKDFALEQNWSTLSARVASDLDANTFWAKHGLVVSRTVAGGKTKNRLIHVQIWNVPGSDLFTRRTIFEQSLAEVGPNLTPKLYAIDINVLLDIVRERTESDSASWLFSSAFSGRVDLAISPEAIIELNRSSPKFQNDPLMKFASRLPILRCNRPSDSKDLENDLMKLVFGERGHAGRKSTNNKSDVAHLAFCIVCRASGFITRDKSLLSCADLILDRYGIEIVTPSALIDSVESSPANLAFESKDHPILVRTANSNDDIQIRELLRKNPQVDPNAFLPRKTTSHKSKSISVAIHQEEVVCLLSWEHGPIGTPDFIANIFVCGEPGQSEFALDQLLEILHAAVKRKDFFRITLQVGGDIISACETLAARGYIRASDTGKTSTMRFTKVGYNGILPKTRVDRFFSQLSKVLEISIRPVFPQSSTSPTTPAVFFEIDLYGNTWRVSTYNLESFLSPVTLGTPGRTGVLVPIQRGYSRNLMPEAISQGQLLPQFEASIRAERVYFLSRNRADLFRKGDLVFFYESKRGGGEGRIIGVGRITYSDYISVDQAYSTLSRQGVISKSRLNHIANEDGYLTAFTFDAFKPIGGQIDIEILKNSGTVSAANLVTSQALDAEQVDWLLQQASAEVNKVCLH